MRKTITTAILSTLTSLSACGAESVFEHGITLHLPDYTDDRDAAICWDVRVTDDRGRATVAGERVCGRDTWVAPCGDLDRPHTVTLRLAKIKSILDLSDSVATYLDPCPNGCALDVVCGGSARLDATLVVQLPFGIDGAVRTGSALCDGVHSTCNSDGERQYIVTDRRTVVPSSPKNWLICGQSASCDGTADGDPTFPDGMKVNPTFGERLPSVVVALGCALVNGDPSDGPTLAANDLQLTCGATTRTLAIADIIANASSSDQRGLFWVSGTRVQWELLHGVDTAATNPLLPGARKVSVALAFDTEASGETCAMTWLAAVAKSADAFEPAADMETLRVLPAFRFGGAAAVADATGTLCFRDTIGNSSARGRIEADYRPNAPTTPDSPLRVLPISAPWAVPTD